MRILYVNNFRGFKETFIPIKRVNFFVGENSTGKTSILKLIKLLSDFSFQYNYEFYSPEVDLGRFEDIVSKFEIDNKFFEVALCFDSLDLESNFIKDMVGHEYKFVKIKYIEKDEKTVLDELHVKSSSFEALIRLKEAEYEYIYFLNTDPTDGNIESRFRSWVTEKNFISKKSKFKKLKNDNGYRNQFRWIISEVLERISSDLSKKNNKKELRYIYELFFGRNEFSPDIKWIAPIRAEPKRIYEHVESKSSADGSHIPQVLKDLLLGGNPKSLIRFKQFLESFGRRSHLFDDIKIRKFGNDKFAPFEIEVYLEGKPYSISNVGYGVSQVLPLLLEIFDEKNKWLAIQQPEVHLHPRAQAEFGEVIYNSVIQTDQVYFIETHSDFTIDRFRFCINQKGSESKDNKQVDTQILFFHRVEYGNKLEQIPIGLDGSYLLSEDSVFRTFFINESINLLGI